MSLHIVAEHFEPVNHCLLAKRAKLSDLKTVFHPQALAQCANHILALNLDPHATLDTAGQPSRLAKESRTDHAAIASSLAAELYGLDIIKEQFQDLSGNTTRFIILSHSQQLPEFEVGVEYLTSILFRCKYSCRALQALGGFATNGVNLIKLESYTPGGSLSASQFHVDIEGHPSSKAMMRALEEFAVFSPKTYACWEPIGPQLPATADNFRINTAMTHQLHDISNFAMDLALRAGELIVRERRDAQFEQRQVRDEWSRQRILKSTN